MAITRTETNETRLYFTLQSADGTATTTRYLSFPGWNEENILGSFPDFRNYMLQNMNQFVQPANWRDSTGSSIDPESSSDPYTTVDVKAEHYTVERVIYDGQ